jgi:predicted GTPase
MFHIQHCKDTVGNELDGRRPLNIAVIGPPGCGKSSFLNTIFASFNNNDRACWREIAKTRDYGEHDIQEVQGLYGIQISILGILRKYDNYFLITF